MIPIKQALDFVAVICIAMGILVGDIHQPFSEATTISTVGVIVGIVGMWWIALRFINMRDKLEGNLNE